MRILTVRQPWAWAIIHGGKDVENRVRNIAGDYRGPVLIHAGLRPERPGLAWGTAADLGGMNTDRYDGDPLHLGHIIGVVDLVDVHRSRMTEGGLLDEGPATCAGQPCSAWAEPDAHHLVLENPRALDEPIPYKGALGLRKTDFFISGDWLGEYIEPDPKHGMCTPYGCPPSCYSAPAARLVATS